MPVNRIDSRAYALGLIHLAEACRALPRVEAELIAVQEALGERADWRRFMQDPQVTAEGKRHAVECLVGEQAHPVVIHFLCLLIEEKATQALDEIIAAFFREVADQREQISGELSTPVPISDARLALIAREAGRVIGKRVSLRVRTDRSILGGVRLKVGDFVMDGTLDHHLDRLRRRLAS